MEINRRDFISFTGAGVASLFLENPAYAADKPAFITTAKTQAGHFEAILLSQEGHILKRHKLPGRGHGGTYDPVRNTNVVFARRPDRYALILDGNAGTAALIHPPEDRHFFGHGVFSADGSLLYATENAFEEEKGVIGVYDAANDFNRVGEFDSGGIGPHDLCLSKDGQHLVIANGGILTHPEYPRQKLNLPDMKPCVTILHAKSGKISKRFILPREHYQISLRHLAGDGDGTIWIGGQYQGALTAKVPLLFKLDNHADALAPVSLKDSLLAEARQYIGSVSVNKSAALAAFSAPRGGLVFIWNLKTNRLHQVIREPDACGLAPHADDFLISSGFGHILSGKTRQTLPYHWDNHILAL
ncbi:MAG: DUF1513 domain-containing protein [Sneathiella sp.]